MLKRVKTAALVLVSLLVLPAAAVAVPGIYVQTYPSAVNMGFAYQGSDLTLTGLVPAGSEVVLKLTQEAQPIAMVGDGKEGLFWLKKHKVTVDGLPGFYVVLASGSLQTLSSSLQKEMGVSPDYANLKRMALVKEDGNGGVLTGNVANSYLQALFNMLEQKKIYQESAGYLKVSADGSYKCSYWLPKYVSAGNIVVTAYAVKGGRLITQSKSSIVVKKAGIGGFLYGLSINNGLLYGFLAVFVAIVAGISIDQLSTIVAKGLKRIKTVFNRSRSTCKEDVRDKRSKWHMKVRTP